MRGVNAPRNHQLRNVALSGQTPAKQAGSNLERRGAKYGHRSHYQGYYPDCHMFTIPIAHAKLLLSHSISKQCRQQCSNEAPSDVDKPDALQKKWPEFRIFRTLMSQNPIKICIFVNEYAPHDADGRIGRCSALNDNEIYIISYVRRRKKLFSQ